MWRSLDYVYGALCLSKLSDPGQNCAAPPHPGPSSADPPHIRVLPLPPRTPGPRLNTPSSLSQGLEAQLRRAALGAHSTGSPRPFRLCDPADWVSRSLSFPTRCLTTGRRFGAHHNSFWSPESSTLSWAVSLCAFDFLLEPGSRGWPRQKLTRQDGSPSPC